MHIRDKIIMLAHENFLLNADQALNAAEYVIANYDTGCTDEGLIGEIDNALFFLYGKCETV